MPQHTRRPPAPPAPEFYITDPPPREQTTLGKNESTVDGRRSSVDGEGRHREPITVNREPSTRPSPRAEGWHQSEPWAVVMLVSFAIMLLAIYVPGRARFVLIGVSALTSVAGIVMLGRQGLFDPPHDD